MKQKKMYAYDVVENFGDILNKILFERLFGAKLIYTGNFYEAEIIGIGSILGQFIYRGSGIRKLYKLYQVISHKINKIAVLGSGFHYGNENCNFVRNMDFKIVRGKLTEKMLRDKKLITEEVLLGDYGLLSSYLHDKNPPKYLLGIVPHFLDLNSPIFFGIYKKYNSNSILINVRDTPDKVIKEISSCKYIISSSLHGLIVADSFGIPNLWIENKYKPVDRYEGWFKFLDYYSSIELEDIVPIQAIDFLESEIEIIDKKYNVDYNIVIEKQKKLFDFCKNYFTQAK